YKNDGFDQFDVMLDSIRDYVASRIFKVKVQTKTEEQQKRRLEPRMQMNAQHEEAKSAFSPQQQAQQAFNARQAQQGAQNSGMKSGRQGQNVTVVRTVPKVGRNDPCPCGSGKKYKNCHGRNA
ncbi:MAG: SEC-C domain-containing protein, partial [Treponema sp.]|nr:SEC-C domain-containing protein [Treponema sp.]